MVHTGLVRLHEFFTLAIGALNCITASCLSLVTYTETEQVKCPHTDIQHRQTDRHTPYLQHQYSVFHYCDQMPTDMQEAGDIDHRGDQHAPSSVY